MAKLRFSLLTLLLIATAAAAVLGVRYRAQAWGLDARFPGGSQTICYSDDCRLVAVYKDASVCVLETSTGKQRISMPTRGDWKDSAVRGAFSPDNRLFAFADYIPRARGESDDMVRLLELNGERELPALEVYTAGEPNDFSLEYEACKAMVAQIAFSPDGCQLVTSNQDNTKNVRIWDPDTGKEIQSIGELRAVNPMYCSKTSSRVYFGRYGQSVSAIDLKTGKLQTGESATKDIRSIHCLPDGRILLRMDANDQKESIHLCDPISLRIDPKPLLEIKDDQTLYPIRGSTALVFGRHDVYVRELLSGEVKGPLPGCNTDCFSDDEYKYDRDADWMMSPLGDVIAGFDNSGAIIWDVAGGTQQRLAGETVERVAASGQTLYTRSNDDPFISVWSRRRPLGPYWLAKVPETWLFMLAAAALMWRGVRRIATLRLTPRSKLVNS